MMEARHQERMMMTDLVVYYFVPQVTSDSQLYYVCSCISFVSPLSHGQI